MHKISDDLSFCDDLFIIYLCFYLFISDIIGSIVFVWFMLRHVARCAL